MLVLCMYRARTKVAYETVEGAIVIEVARPCDVEKEFEFRMWQRQERNSRLAKLESWRLTSYLPASGKPTW